jgi:hypothetical protein
MRSSWTDVSLDMYDYLEARVEALYEENKRLKVELNFLKGIQEEPVETDQRNEYPVPSVLVC